MFFNIIGLASLFNTHPCRVSIVRKNFTQSVGSLEHSSTVNKPRSSPQVHASHSGEREYELDHPSVEELSTACGGPPATDPK